MYICSRKNQSSFEDLENGDKMALRTIQIVTCRRLDEVKAHAGLGIIMKYAFLSGFLKDRPWKPEVIDKLEANDAFKAVFVCVTTVASNKQQLSCVSMNAS